MEKRVLTYRFGKFFDDSNNKVEFKNNSKLTILFDINDVEFKEANEQRVEVLGSPELELKIKNDKKVVNYKKILSAGQNLYFKIRAVNTRKDLILKFTVELLEDLYLYKIKTGKKKIYDCACKVISVESIQAIKTNYPFEETYGKSLSELYHNTSIKYFGYDRTSTTLVYTSFFTSSWFDKSSVIDRFRKEFIEYI